MFALSETYVMRFHSLAKQNLTHFSEAGAFSNHSYIVFNRNATKSARQKVTSTKISQRMEKESWDRNWICMSKKGVSKAYCKVCDKDLASGKSELISHSKTAAHIAQMKQVESSRSMQTFLEESLNRNKVKAELNTVALMARRSEPLRFLDHLLETLHFVADDSKTIRDTKCNRSKGTYLLTECLSTHAHQRLLEGIRTANGSILGLPCVKFCSIALLRI